MRYLCQIKINVDFEIKISHFPFSNKVKVLTSKIKGYELISKTKLHVGCQAEKNDVVAA